MKRALIDELGLGRYEPIDAKLLLELAHRALHVEAAGIYLHIYKPIIYAVVVTQFLVSAIYILRYLRCSCILTYKRT